ncbi:sensor histidine kinase [Oceanicella actignis]|uniref:sensor histidine kinase n=1 Tax=Oceanicella actignis TaxID=1189325 RepID=UPI0011E80CFF|nr:ATP-binding protein [Oceanicella actignis]TYO91211.1 two-component system phosphate regulon sensor histidine kinase PhoR [Oceanicella actignis]
MASGRDAKERRAALGAGAASLAAATLAAAAGAGPAGLAAAGAAALGLWIAAQARASDPAPDSDTAPSPPRAGPPPAPPEGRDALEAVPVALLAIDRAGRIAFANAAARALVPRAAPGVHHAACFRHPEFVAALKDTLRDGAPRAVEFAMHSGPGRWLRAHLSKDEGGALCALEDRTRDVRAQQMRTDFVANASHELRTPLASIMGFIDTLSGPARDDPEAQARFLAIMRAQAERMSRLVDDLLSLSRIELDEHVPPSGRLDLHAAAREAAAAFEPMARARGVTIELAAPEPGPVVRADRDQLAQALGNLIENALKYGGGKPVRVRPAPADPLRPRMAGICVEDQGEGVAREHIPRLTERFYRVSVKRSRDQGGTGLGLAIVKHIMTRHRGELQIESAPGRGSRFTLWLPLAD